jgi:hypothetical protein
MIVEALRDLAEKPTRNRWEGWWTGISWVGNRPGMPPMRLPPARTHRFRWPQHSSREAGKLARPTCHCGLAFASLQCSERFPTGAGSLRVVSDDRGGAGDLPLVHELRRRERVIKRLMDPGLVGSARPSSGLKLETPCPGTTALRKVR